MENGGNVYCAHNDRNRGQQNGNTNLLWDMWEPNSSRFDWTNTSNSSTTAIAAATTTTPGESTNSTHPEAASTHALVLPNENLYLHHYHHHEDHYQQHSLYGGEGSNLHPDPHLMCLKLGKRHYFEDNIAVGERQVASLCIGKKKKSYYSVVDGGTVRPLSSAAGEVVAAAAVPKCQVEGCHVVLVNAKDYHRRHKVCEMHSKAPKVTVLGLEQRFCQQCSRFHVVSEFDESKRSCRRRLAGHNERRRKSAHDSVSRNSCPEKLMARRIPCLASTTGRALSLLSSKEDSWVSSSDLSSRSSAALRELIAENRAAILARQLVLDRHWHHNNNNNDNGMENLGGRHQSSQASSNSCFVPHQHQILAESQNWGRFHDSGTQLTLDLMQAPSSAFGFLPTRAKNTKDEEESCAELWDTWAGAHI
ncbi:hypothetical protein JCGZ_14586 [Jatropha curcas]|uniref:SBP-type domain-containing protein n=1 Tax=Jatropha curcas TaxID=180498 RepID=A0A067K966_JATCU|nr:squamosa promoter-binding-like protein 7 [Jatropha curcas]KDP28815.1 hypothetical protein JCGZ_14586 [Jatropha curcas]